MFLYCIVFHPSWENVLDFTHLPSFSDFLLYPALPYFCFSKVQGLHSHEWGCWVGERFSYGVRWYWVLLAQWASFLGILGLLSASPHNSLCYIVSLACVKFTFSSHTSSIHISHHASVSSHGSQPQQDTVIGYSDWGTSWVPGTLAECFMWIPSCVHGKSLQCCLTHCDPVDCSPPGSSVHGILQERILEWVAISSSKGSSQLRDQTHVSLHLYIGRQDLYHECHQGSPFFH